MKANEEPINKFLQAPDVQFIIPVYQRNYDWSNSECKEILNDIIAVQEKERGTHFIGSIVFIHEGTYSTSEVKELVIIDGQQRLTTINILYVALYRFAKKNNKTQEAERLYNKFLINQYVQKESSKLKLKQTDSNSRAFQAILNGTEMEFDDYSNVVENYNYFSSRINEDNFITIQEGLKRLIFVEVSLERDKDDPQRIFESLNSTGLDLSQSDLIRNYILMDLKPKEQNKLFTQIWSPIEENARDLTKQKSMVSDFIRDYLTLKNKKIPNKGKVYQEFKIRYGNKKDESFNEELDKMKSLSVHYKKLINPSSVQDSNLRLQLQYINRLEVNVAYPFLLQVFEDEDNGIIDQSTLLKVMALIQSFAFRRFIVGLPTNALNRIFMTLYSEVDQEDYYDSIATALIRKRGSAKFPTDEEVQSALKERDLYSIKTKNRTYMFEMLENHNNREYVDTSSENITIEHIFPQTPTDSWNSELNSDEFYLFKEKYLNTIGNLTLSGNNGALGNKSFSEKKLMNLDGKEQGYKYSRLWLNGYLQKIETWDVKNYQARLEIIYNRFISIWKYPTVIMPTLTGIGEQSIFDIADSNNKKLEYFIFEDTKVYEIAASKMYYHILRKLYEENPQLTLNQLIVKITRDSSYFTESYEIFTGYYIDPRTNNQRKFRIIKELLRLFEKEDELLVKFSEESDSQLSTHSIRRNYWKQLLPLICDTELFQNVNPTKDHWLSTGSGIGGVSYTLVISKSFVRIELTLSTSNKLVNKKYFNQLRNVKIQIEERFGHELEWEELPNNKMSRVKFELGSVSILEESDIDTMNNFVIDNLPAFENAFKPEIEKIR